MKRSLKLKKNHPAKAFRIGRHVVGQTYKTFDLNEEEEKELKTKGVQHWVMEAPKKSAAKKSVEK